MTDSPSYTAQALSGIPMIQPGDDLAAIIIEAIKANDIQPQTGDVMVISSKIVSKAENRYINLDTVQPNEDALRIAEETQKDPRVVQVVLDESTGISRKAPNVLITEHRLGFVSANSAIDQSNIDDSDHHVLILPEDPDASARQLQERFREAYSVDMAVVISDTHGRPFRVGNIGAAIGIAGLPAVMDLRGSVDLMGRTLKVSIVGYADLVASAAHLLCGEAAEGLPVVYIRGLQFTPEDSKASQLNRRREMDLYR